METHLLVGLTPHVLMMSVHELLKWKLNFQRPEIVAGMGEELDRHHVRGEIYQATYIF